MWAQPAALLALLCLLQVGAEMPVQADFQQEQFTGTWYSIGLASNSRWFKEKRQVIKMCTTVVTPTEDGNLDIVSTYPKLDQCETKRTRFFQTEEPGRFTYTSPWSGSAHNIRVLETNYDEFALLGDTITKGADTFTMVTLYGRQRQLRPELLAKFTQTALGQGLAQEDILLLPRTADLCLGETA
ncbi:lipocalin-like isoform X1 [Crotalus tigris]|uniref:lipocalin-like isoform X1 n=1 Tax=Crotalus tigris TaxID=88082 RepID=UPI00192F286F|nr:lipocalin-like isoform X1 [Crotalus tigris]